MHDESGGAHGSGSSGGSVVAEALRPEPLRTLPLSANHRVTDFRCERSARIAAFFSKECVEFIEKGYCRVFILPNPSDPTHILGYYTLSPSLLTRNRATGSDQKRVVKGLPIPMCLVGFMGRCDSAPKGIGESLIVDAARRVHRNPDMPAWGLMLDSEGGPDTKLWKWYLSQGFTPAKDEGTSSGVLYGALKKFVPELKS
ncbi:hypothetical protein IVA93_16805 [Bradyrhizobium sp. 155]|uniref:hypothetical protein n=1 Tax=Bradyrhizobium sp. 155 TaxID=2782629 RepID=UPI001FFF29B3|nr:hypothetical protein [Bradyrhizobium sp. 155]UPK14705.1 hypothetical protein IVA93_16805 [Bradyrhizobium sp. 155]